MKVFQPQVSVKLVKAIRRDKSGGIVPGTAVASRYQNLASIDLTNFLGDNGSVQTSKSVREPAGGFTITLADKRHPQMLDTLYALIEPMDMVEIRFCRDPSSYKQPDLWPPIIMRGLVTTVSRSEAIPGGRPTRSITIAGQDFGKILQTIQIYYLYNSVVGDNVLHEFAFFQKYASASSAKIKSANEFVTEVVSNVINPYLSRLTALADGSAVSAKVINAWTPVVSIAGALTPDAVCSMNNISLHSFLSTLLDVGPFNELFVEDATDGINLVVRPAPFMDVAGNLIQGEMPAVNSITDKEALSLSLSRSDQGVANYFWVSNSRFAFMGNEDQKAWASTGSPDSYLKFDYLNSQSAYYGFRKMEVESVLVDPGYGSIDAQTKDQLPAQNSKMTDWLSERRRILAESNKDNVIFEFGQMQVRGDERIKAGTYLRLNRANGVTSQFYVPQVNHSYTPFQGFLTNLTLERGTSFIERAKAGNPQYLLEVNAKGIS